MGGTCLKMRKIPANQLRTWAIAHVKSKQGGLCPLCKQPIDFTTRGNKQNYAVDHNHDTGEIRGVLHSSCNAAEGKAANAIGRWGSKDTSYPAIIEFTQRLLEYWQTAGTGLMYPRHLTPEEKAEKARLQRNKTVAARRARERAAALKKG